MKILELREMLDAKTEKEKWERNYFLFKYDDTIKKELDALKNIEERTHCSIDVVSTIIDCGFYYEYGYIPPHRIYSVDVFKKEIGFFDEENDWYIVKLSDRNKTWWLNEEEWKECIKRNII